MSDELPPFEDESEGERILREDQQALFGALASVLDERGMDETELVPLLIDALYHFRALTYVMETAKPSESGLRLDLDRLRKLIDEVHRDYRKSAASVLGAMVEAVAASTREEEQEDAEAPVIPKSVISDGSGR